MRRISFSCSAEIKGRLLRFMQGYICSRDSFYQIICLCSNNTSVLHENSKGLMFSATLRQREVAYLA